MVKQRRLCNLILCLISSRTIAFRSSRSLANRSPARKSRLSLLRKQPFGADRWHSLPTALFAEDEYARGADIWPPSGDDAVKLEDSFPKGEIPFQATAILEKAQNKGPVKRQRRKFMPRAISRISRNSDDEGTLSNVEKTPAVIALVLLFKGYVRPLDVFLVTFLTGYFCILGLRSRSLRVEGGVTPIMPTLPPQGHVPTLVSNPLGQSFTNSRVYDLWLKLGILVGLLGPMALCLRYTVGGSTAAARLCARPLFFLCWQAVSEGVSRRVMAPLPLRVLIPVCYNAVRLGYLWNWTTSGFVGTSSLGAVGQFLGLANLLYWTTNLFGFLLPVAVIRYMRAHFFCVEAEQVTTRVGMEESIGMSSYS